MTFTVLLTFLLILIFTSKLIIDTVLYRKKITIMAGMMISMVLGMMVGFTTGIITGILLTDAFFYSTIISAFVGIATGFIVGVPIGWLAIFDGILAGLMGGTMGAMIGAMMDSEYHDQLIKLTLILYVAIMLLLYRIMQKQIIKKQSLLSNPIVLTFLFLITIVTYNQSGSFVPTSKSNQVDGSIRNLVVTANDNIFLPDKIKVKAGEKLKITLDNIGKSEHDFEIVNIEATSIETQSSQHHHNKGNNQIHIHSLPGEKQAISFIPVTPGEYKYVCTIPGHAESGMIGSIEVTL
ncbi:cupredoxin domain-containing protein [Ureibacillus chungkukjangi]|uniref:EfeO-type cupredoxin-like domain-containing protein n=1 Tax=Ureibacillus chungkukjangi TaxID=1202712 RepID=A0A318TFL4_9BACL|nr:cupredoxin domain-containing protein [Ureibacillus chungkukjangi]PYF02637.1 hypothetical protein BJ095_13914 [Ureibacillus chungkukjangi]